MPKLDSIKRTNPSTLSDQNELLRLTVLSDGSPITT